MKKTKINNKIFCSLLLFVLTASITLTATPVSAVTITTCDSGGTAQTTFNPDQDVYFTASDLSPSATYPIYVLIKNESWTTGMAFPTRYYNTATTVSADSSGNMAPTCIYTDVACGEYYVVLDVNSNDVYDVGDLLIDDLVITLEVTTKTSGGLTISTMYLTPFQLYEMPSYTGVGCPRRSGGYFPPEQVGNYTGVPLMVLCNMVGGISGSSSIAVSTDVDDYTTTLYYTQVHDNIYTQYNISKGAVIYGQQPIMMLAYKVNGTMLSSDGSGLGSNTDLGGPLRLIVVANNGTSPILVNDGMATFGNSYVKAVSKIVITVPSALTYDTATDAGVAETEFSEEDTVCLSATGLSASTEYSVYVVEHVSEWAVRTTIPISVSDIDIVTTNGSGNIVAIDNPIYGDAAAGSYDVVVDVNSNGQYDETDILIYNAAGTCGFIVT